MNQTESGSPRLAALVVFLIAAAALSFRVGGMGLLEPDEARYASVAQAMLNTGDFITPRFNGAVYLDKPPMLHWLTALSMWVLGPTEFAVRLFPLLAAAAGVALVYALGRRIWGHNTGLAAAFVLLTSAMWFVVGRTIRFDTILSLCVTATIAWAWIGSEDPKANRRYFYLAAGAMGLGILVKGPVAAALPGIILVAYLALGRRLDRLARMPWLGCLAIVAAIVAPWFALCEMANPGAVKFFILHENISRVQGGFDPNHQHPWWYLIAATFMAMVPWTLLLPGSLWHGVKAARLRESPARRGALLAVIWLVAVVAAFSLSTVKLFTYILPATPAAALLIGRLIAARMARLRWVLIATGALLAAFGAAMCIVGPEHAIDVGVERVGIVLAFGLAPAIAGLAACWAAIQRRNAWAVGLLGLGLIVGTHIGTRGAEMIGESPSHRELASVVHTAHRPGERIYAFRKLSRGTMFYLNTRMGIIGDRATEWDFPGNEGTYGDWLVPTEEADAFLAESPPMLLLVRDRFRDRFEEQCPDRATEVGRWNSYAVMRSIPDGAEGLHD